MASPSTSSGKRSVLDVFLNKMRSEFVPPEQKNKEKQIRVKKDSYGEVLTSREVLKRLQEEEADRIAKKMKRNVKNLKVTPQKSTKRRKRIKVNQKKLSSSNLHQVNPKMTLRLSTRMRKVMKTMKKLKWLLKTPVKKMTTHLMNKLLLPLL